MSTRWLVLLLCIALPVLLLAGCAVDPIEEQQENLDSMKLTQRQMAIDKLKVIDDERAIELLVEALEGDPDLLESAGNTLVLKGREWETEHPNAKKSEQNPVIEQLSATIGDMHLESPVRTKACWILGEIGSRRAIGALTGRANDASSMKVRVEYVTSLKKLGYYGTAAEREMLDDGRFVEAYDPAARGMVITEDEADETADEDVDEAADEATEAVDESAEPADEATDAADEEPTDDETDAADESAEPTDEDEGSEEA